LAATRTLRSTCPSPARDPSSAPGSPAKPATTRTATPAARARKNYAATSPITRAPGKKKTVAARFIRNDRPTDALTAQACTALSTSPGARALHDAGRARGAGHNPAPRKVAHRLAGILHGCLKTRTLYDEATAWPHHENKLAA
jgi:hypothetical protein